ncbi:MAG: hypothetical protein JXR03_07290 [Cyclobacteriaceae bacterium]
MKYLIISFILSATACKSDKQQEQTPEGWSQQIKNDIAAITDNDDLKGYLEYIYDLDQKVRKEESQALKEHGRYSDEYPLAVENLLQVDNQNFQRIDAILAQFGYPSPDSVGRKAAQAPWIIVHRSKDYAYRIKHFPIIYDAYAKGNISDNAISRFLDGTYRIKFNRKFSMSGSYEKRQKIDELIKALELKTSIVE